MPTITATNAPHAAATMTSRRRLGLVWLVSFIVALPSRHLQHAGLPDLDDGERIEQHHERAERERDRDVAGAAAALLLLGEHDAVVAVLVHDRHPRLTRCGPTGDRAGRRRAAPQRAGTDRGSRSRTAASPP